VSILSYFKGTGFKLNEDYQKFITLKEKMVFKKYIIKIKKPFRPKINQLANLITQVMGWTWIILKLSLETW